MSNLLELCADAIRNYQDVMGYDPYRMAKEVLQTLASNIDESELMNGNETVRFEDIQAYFNTALKGE